MPLPAQLRGRLKIPAIAAPMFLVSGPDLVVASCRAGIVGSFPALNQRTTEGFDDWLLQIEKRLDPEDPPYGVNLIVHHTNPRLEADLKVCEAHKVPLIITSLGAVADLVTRVHAYGGLVFHDVTTLRHARKAAEAGV
ncbi:MAG: nitronate monooxygenase, partial [Alphaproteobacteria bacterium]|nr:nitronate monooxygenase [Alphaproteobacteria bacterium]